MADENITDVIHGSSNFSWSTLNSDVDRSLLPVTMILGIYLVAGVLGNLLVVFIYVFRWEAPPTDRFFVPILALLDMGACLVSASVGIYAHMNIVRFQSDALCKIVAFLGIFFVKMSGDLLVIIAVDRHLKINKPFETQMSYRWKKISVIVMVFVALTMSVPSLFTYGAIKLAHPDADEDGWLCANSNDPHGNIITVEWCLKVFYQHVMLLDVLLKFIALVIIYSRIAKAVCIRSRMRAQRISKRWQNTDRACPINTDIQISRDGCSSSMELNGNTETCERELTPPSISRLNRHSSRLDCQRVRLTMIFMLITAIYIISMGPKVVIMISDAMIQNFWTIEPTPTFGLLRFLYTLFILNNVVNPFIYGFFDRRFRRELYRLFACGVGNNHNRSSSVV